MKLIRRRYDETYYRAKPSGAPSPRQRHRLRELLAYKSGGELLEVGFGRGELLELAQSHFGVSGIELSAYAVRRLRPRFGDRIRQGDIARDPLPAGQYDLIAAFNVLEHLSYPAQAIANLYQGLKAGGVLIGSVPNNSTPVGQLYTALTNLLDRTHCSTLPPARWRALLSAGGFDHIALYGEVMLGEWWCSYLRGPHWPYFSFNMILAGQHS
jgi:SAM-dependent methyltransferase